MSQLVIDASHTILGRLASYAAKQSLLGHSIIIVNCNYTTISGRKSFIVNTYKDKRSRGGSAMKGPNFPSQPFMVVKRTIRGMLSYKQGRGEDAFARIKCYNDVPKEFESAKKSIAALSNEHTATKTIPLAEVCRII